MIRKGLQEVETIMTITRGTIKKVVKETSMMIDMISMGSLIEMTDLIEEMTDMKIVMILISTDIIMIMKTTEILIEIIKRRSKIMTEAGESTQKMIKEDSSMKMKYIIEEEMMIR